MYYTHDDHSSSVCSPSRSCCSTQGAWKWYYIPPHDIESIQTRRRCGQQALVFRRCNKHTIEFRSRGFKILLAPHSNITVSVFTTPLGSEQSAESSCPERATPFTIAHTDYRLHVFIYKQTTEGQQPANSPLHPRQDFDQNPGSTAEERHGVGTVRHPGPGPGIK